MAACSAQIGSTSVMMTRAPWPRRLSAQPLPTSPYPHTSATLPPISTSVPRLMPSMSECRQPYLLSNLDLVTESLTLMAGNSRVPALAISYSRCTPVVVSSVTPLIVLAALVHLPGWSASELRSRSKMMTHSSGSSLLGLGTPPACSYSAPLCTNSVASPPSSRIMLGPSLSGQVSASSVQRQYSSSVSPFQAKTGMPRGLSGVPSGPTDGRGGVVLGGEDVAGRPADLRAERGQRLDQHGGLDRHVQAAGDPGAAQRLAGRVFLAHRHQPRHLVLGQLDFLAPERGE